MSRIVVERSHNLGRETARTRAEQLAERLTEKFGLRCQWSGDTLQVRRSGADGQIEVGEDRVRIELKLGMLLAVMSGDIRRGIEQALDKSLQV